MFDPLPEPYVPDAQRPTVRALTPEEAAERLRANLVEVFRLALGLPPEHPRISGMTWALRRHPFRDGFRAFGAFDSQGRPVGFSYGYTGAADDWWLGEVSGALAPEQRTAWTGDCFELAELHLRPEYHGLGLGSELHDRLLQGVPARAALLSVMHRSAQARRLYFRRGWQMLVPDMRFSTEPQEPFSILGLDLPSANLPRHTD